MRNCQGSGSSILPDAVCFSPRNRNIDTSLKCCKEPQPANPIEQCSKYFRDGFSCVNQSECLDDLLSHSEGGLTINKDINVENYNPRGASCPKQSEVCCLNPLPPIRKTTEKVCDRNPGGYECHPLPDCDLDRDILEDDGDHEVIEPEEPTEDNSLDIRQASFLLNHEFSKCNKDLHVCCIPKEKIFKTPVPAAPNNTTLRCGTHNPNGLDIKVTKPSDREFATQFGEWPHTCLLYKLNSLDNYEFVGGASLIAPGVVLTAAHKVG